MKKLDGRQTIVATSPCTKYFGTMSVRFSNEENKAKNSATICFIQGLWLRIEHVVLSLIVGVVTTL